jgi:hypothetical protein
MNKRLLTLLFLFIGLLAPIARAETSLIARGEIDYLLQYVGKSGCEFYRNGTWRDAKAAQAHLRSKYDMFATHGQIATAEDFIGKVATKSSLSGQAYEARCSDGAVVTSNQWLSDALARHRGEMRTIQ